MKSKNYLSPQVPTIADVFLAPSVSGDPQDLVRFFLADSVTEDHSLNEAELSALAQDGILTHVFGSLYADAPVSTPGLKAQALTYASDPRWGPNPIFCRWSAAWVYGVAFPPTVIEFMSDVYIHPFKENKQQFYRNHQAALDSDYFWNIGPATVISPAQCAAELLVHVNTPQAHIAAAAIVGQGSLRTRSSMLRKTMQACDGIGRMGQRRRAQKILADWKSWCF